MSRTTLLCRLLCLISLVVPMLAGCSGDDAKQQSVAQAAQVVVAAPAPAPAPTPVAASNAAGASGGGSGGGGDSYDDDDGGMGDEGGGGGMNAMDAAFAADVGGGEFDDEEGMEGMFADMDGADDGGMGGFDGGMGGFDGGLGGAARATSFTQINQFMSRNCYQCHGRRQAKGDIRLNGLTSNFDDPTNVERWKQVLEQLETEAMPPEKARRRPTPAQRSTVVTWIQDSLADSMFADSEADFLAKAKYSFGVGKEKEAINYLYAHVIASDDAVAKEVLEQSRWFALKPQPTTTLRFAVGVDLTAPTTLTDIKPIGSSQFGGGGGGGFDDGGSGGGRTRRRQRSFNSLTGDFGVALVGAFETRWFSGDLGSVFSDVVAIDPRASNRDGGGGFGGAGMDSGFGGGFDGDEGFGGMDGGFDGGMDGGFDEGFGGSGGGGFDGDDAYGEGPVTTIRDNIMPGQVVTPGLVYIGSGSQSELRKRAADQRVDAVFLFDVTAKANRINGIVQNETRLRIMLTNGKALGATKTLKNTDIERDQLRGTGDDEVQKNIDRLFVVFDAKIKLAAMPALKPEHARNRLRQLLAARDALKEDDESGMDMALLYETRLFNSMGLVSQEDMSKVFQIVLKGDEGQSLASGTPADRKLVLDSILPRYN